jgi:hypothetical protein
MDSEQKLIRRKRQLQVLVLVLFIAFVVALLLRGPLQERETIRSMPEPERRAAFDKEMAAFKALCIEGPGSQLDARCRERAEFLEQFPECDQSCRALTGRFVPQGAR